MNNWELLTGAIYISDVLPYLISKGTVTTNIARDIRDLQGRANQTGKLLEIIHRGNPETAEDAFMDCLQSTGYEHISMCVCTGGK